MQEDIHERIKIGSIKWGDARIFGEDSDVRRKLPDAECIERFATVWETTLAPEVAQAPEITQEEAKELLEEKFKPFATAGYKYRQFLLHQVPFVCRVTIGGVCDQLWALGAHRDNTRLCMHFNTIKDKERFDAIAKRFGWEPKVLALRLCTDFMQKIERFGDPDSDA